MNDRPHYVQWEKAAGQRYFHSTDALFEPGVEIVPATELGIIGRWPDATHYDPSQVYLWSPGCRTTDGWGEYVYEVEPQGKVQPDPERAINPDLGQHSWVVPRARVLNRLSDDDWGRLMDDVDKGRYAAFVESLPG